MKRVLILVLLASSSYSFAQQDPQFTQFMFDKLSVNPGYAGINNNLCFTGFYRQQWTGFDGAPTTILFQGHAPIKSINSGVGLTLFNDELGQETSNIIRGHYSYHFKNVGTGKLGLGVSIGYVSKSLGNDKWLAIDPVSSDNSIPDNGTTAGTMDFSFGAFYQADKFYVGLSSTHLSEGEMSDLNIATARHYYLMAGYEYAVSPSFDLLPNILMKSDAASTQIDINVIGMYKDMLWVGVSGRADDAVAPMIGYRHELNDGLAAIRIGYSYDVTLSELNNYSSGSHEIMLNYCRKLKKPLPPQIYKNVRFL